jgi:hypothetical protein
MNIVVKNRLIQCIDELMSYRLTDNNGLPNDLFLLIKNLHAKEDYRELIRQLKIFFHINCSLDIGFSPSEKNPNCALLQGIMRDMKNNGITTFNHSLFLSVTGANTGKPKGAAEMILPVPMPLLNSQSFKAMKLKMIVKRWVFMMPLETIIFLVAHELGHILLYASQSRYYKSEIATDILAMILVGPDMARKGMYPSNFKFGYLNAEQLEVVYNEIKIKMETSNFSKIKEKGKISGFSKIKSRIMNLFKNL